MAAPGPELVHLVLGALEGGGKTGFLGGGGLVVVFGAADHAVRLRRQPLLDLVDLPPPLHHFRMLIEVLFEQLRLLLLEGALLDSELLDHGVPHHIGKVLRVARAVHLAVERLFTQSGRPRVRQRRTELLQLLGDERPPLLDVDDAFPLLELLQLLRALLDLLSLLLDLASQPLARFRRSLVAELQRLTNVELRELVRDVRREVGTERLEPDTHDPGALGAVDTEAPEQPVDRAFHQGGAPGGSGQGRLYLLGRTRTSKLRVLEQVQVLDDTARQRSALEEAVLGLVVVVTAGVVFRHVLEGEDVRVLAFDEDLRRRHVDRATLVAVRKMASANLRWRRTTAR